MRRSLLERLREKPKEVRVQVAFVTALCVTGIIGLAWGATLPLRLDGAYEEDTLAGAESGGFFTDARANLGQLISATKDTVSEEDASPSGAYTPGVPQDSVRNSYSLSEPEAGVAPVNRREVLIATTTSRTAE